MIKHECTETALMQDQLSDLCPLWPAPGPPQTNAAETFQS